MNGDFEISATNLLVFFNYFQLVNKTKQTNIL